MFPLDGMDGGGRRLEDGCESVVVFGLGSEAVGWEGMIQAGMNGFHWWGGWVRVKSDQRAGSANNCLKPCMIQSQATPFRDREKAIREHCKKGYKERREKDAIK